jgi:hypothetical protein
LIRSAWHRLRKSAPSRRPAAGRWSRIEALEDRLTPALSVTDLSPGLTPTDLVNSLLGGGVTVSNVTYTGAQDAAGTFTGGNGIIGFDKGIILSTGDAKNVIGPNKSESTSTDNNAPGDPILDAQIPGGTTHDAAVLEFDFVPQGDRLQFNYVFGSEEYNEFVNSQFNDVFGFFVNGKNVAVLPGTQTSVAINNVNAGNPVGTNATNPQFFINNDLASGAHLNTELDGLTVVLSVRAKVNPGVANHIKLAIADTGDAILDSDVFIQAGTFFSATAAKPLYATGADEGGGPHVKVFDPATGKVVQQFMAYDPSFRGGVRVASADINGDGVTDVVTAPGPGMQPLVRVFDGATGALMEQFLAYDASFTGGVYVAVGDVNGDGFPDIITGAGPGGGPNVRAFDGAGGGMLANFFAYDPTIRSGVRVAAGDVNGDGATEVVTAPGPGYYPQVKIFNAMQATGAALPEPPPGEAFRQLIDVMPGQLGSFMAYDPNFRGGVYLAVGDLNADGRADIVTGAGPGGGPHVKAFDPLTLTAFQSFMAFDPNFTGGVRVAVESLNGHNDILAAAGPGGLPIVQAYDPLTRKFLFNFFAYDPSVPFGVFIG